MARNSRVACLLADGFEDYEFLVPYERLQKAGFDVDIIGDKRGDTVCGKHGKEKIEITHAVDDVRPDDYGLLLIPGGHSPDQLRADPRFVAFVRDFDATGHPIAAICHGPQLLASAGLVRGRTMTAWATVQDDLREMGADVRDEAVVQDQNWITSRKPGDLDAFCAAILETMADRGPPVHVPFEAGLGRELD